MKKKNIKNLVLCLLIGPLLIYIIYNLYISVSVLVFPDHLWIDYCDSFEINNNNAENEQDTQIRSEDNRDRRKPFGLEGERAGEENRKEFTLKDKIKQRLYWHTWEQHKNKYRSYKEFKKSWDPNQSIRVEIKKDIQVTKDKIRLHKRTLDWFLGLRKRNRYGNSPNQR